MSLTSLVRADSPVRRWMAETFPHVALLQADWRAQVAGLPTVRPPTRATPFPYSIVGMAADYRIRYALTLTPPEDLTAYSGAVLYDL